MIDNIDETMFAHAIPDLSGKFCPSIESVSFG